MHDFDGDDANDEANEASDDEAPRTWTLYEEGNGYTTIEASSVEEALDAARANVDRANYDLADDAATLYVEIRVECERTGEEARATVSLGPEEPACVDAAGHDWQSPHALVGGCRENPGVWGHGAGVIIHEACIRCGCQRRTDTWATDRSNGRQGVTEVSYVVDEYADEIEDMRRKEEDEDEDADDDDGDDEEADV